MSLNFRVALYKTNGDQTFGHHGSCSALLSEAVDQRVNFDGIKLRGIYSDIILVGVDFEQSDMTYTWFENVSFRNCILPKKIDATRFKNCEFEYGKLSTPYGKLSTPTLNSGSKATFIHCTFKNVDLTDFKLTHAIFKKCDFSAAFRKKYPPKGYVVLGGKLKKL